MSINGISGILMPKDFPPHSGTQLGIVTLIVFNARMRVFTIPISPLTVALNAVEIPSHISLQLSFRKSNPLISTPPGNNHPSLLLNKPVMKSKTARVFSWMPPKLVVQARSNDTYRPSHDRECCSNSRGNRCNRSE